MPDNFLYYGDNLEVLRKYIKDETVDLCYIDPPFNSKRNYNQIYNNLGKDDKAQAQAFIDTWTWDTRAEEGLAEIVKNYNGVFTKQSINLIIGLEKVLSKGSLLAYLVSMTLRVAEICRVLKSTGSFYFHCDPTASHYLKLIIDAIFCSKGGDFRNEIIWCYRRYTGVSNKFQKIHDVILFYSKSDNPTFNTILVDYKDKSGVSDSHYKQDDDGKWFRWQKRRNQEAYKIYLKDGVRMGDWWDIPIINASARERLGYPTQKPEALLDRIITASSNEGDTVLDIYCGCGTSVAVAERLNRKWIGVDITYQSISVILKRIEDHFDAKAIDNISINVVPNDMDSAIALAHKKDDRLRKEFEKWAVLTFSKNKAIINEKKGGDKGIDGISFVVDMDDKSQQVTKEVIFSVKSDKVLSPSVIRDLNGTIERDKAAMGYLITLYPMANLIRESKQYGMYENKRFGHHYPKIEVISVEEILDGKQMNLPVSLDVLKTAEGDRLSIQGTLL